MKPTPPIVQRNSPSAAAARPERGSWYPCAAAIVLNAALLAVVVAISAQEDRYGPFIERFAYWFVLPGAAMSLIIAAFAWWRGNKAIAILGITFHGVALLALLLWTLGWGFMGLWAQSPRGSLVGLVLQIGAGEGFVIAAQGAIYIVLLVRMYGARGRAETIPQH